MERKIYLLDTNIVSECSKVIKNPGVVNRLKEVDAVCAISAPSYYEILIGLEIMPEGKKKARVTDYFETVIQEKYPIIPYDEHAASIHSHIVSELRKIGKPRPFIDTQIASIAIANNMILVTHNTADFEGIPLLMMEDWFEL